MILAIAVQSAVAIVEISTLHHEQSQDSHNQGTQYAIHDDSDHHSPTELREALANNANHNESDHPECHYNHCHHSNILYIGVSDVLVFNQPNKYQVLSHSSHFSSFLISPDLRPPIV